MFSRRTLAADVMAGLLVACVAIPLSLAIALASGVEPGVGLISAIVAGIVCALMGGTRLAVSGPAAAMTVIVAAVVQEQGTGGLLVVVMAAGLLQLLTGLLGAGRLIRFVPLSVVAGFTAGIGAIILIGQLPRALGLQPPEQSHILDVLTHLRELIGQSDPRALGLTVLTMGIAFGLPRFLPRSPALLAAVVVPTVLVWLTGMSVELIGEIPRSLPLPSLPALPEGGWGRLASAIVLVFAVASLETLLSSSAVDKMTSGKRHDPDQELIGQGLGNLTVALFGGLVVTGVIVRSSVNVHAGARTRLASIVHAGVLLATVLVLAPVMSRIPVAALAGVLLSVAVKMLHPRELVHLWHNSRPDALAYLITFVTIVFVDLLVGVQAGIAAALVLVALRLGQMHIISSPRNGRGTARMGLAGPVTFMASGKLERLRHQLESLEPGRPVLLDLSGVSALDASGAELLGVMLSEQVRAGRLLAVKGLSPGLQRRVLAFDASGRLGGLFVTTEAEARELVHGDSQHAAREALVSGVLRFKEGASHSRYSRLLEHLSEGQAPLTLFITCSDSRLSPNLFTSSDPGELFVVRNVGNLVPPCDSPGAPGVGAAIDYAVEVLGVREIIVCAHSGCGAVKAVQADTPSGSPFIDQWLADSRRALRELPSGLSAEELSQQLVLRQVRHLERYPSVHRRMHEDHLRVRAWFYDIRNATLLEWDEAHHAFMPVGAHEAEESEEAQTGGEEPPGLSH
ncbi:bifunctional SulP family inorganic anion transporter/carbonic anhydrase [Archangium sp.]|uniref:bifunctional SulP family inorganic anion transporter/carbonic anhydrase n=1 Tax=Archangium sp. TaxID=1872627 RepID=UPI002D2840DD|nr:bifunctional SulP family inorganic anion transporter/carbonic anhydrase [Archangium sp.]HYO55639.1 bifunctional SulP family inorganic anion transporter/carbonic anhydrase [Archangium sp.]